MAEFDNRRVHGVKEGTYCGVFVDDGFELVVSVGSGAVWDSYFLFGGVVYEISVCECVSNPTN